MGPSDRGLVRAIARPPCAATGLIRQALAERMARGLPPRQRQAQADPDCRRRPDPRAPGPASHAAVDTAVTLAREDGHGPALRRSRQRGAPPAGGRAGRYPRRRRPARDRHARLAPRALDRRLRRGGARAIAAAQMREPSVDLTAASDPAGWAEQLGGTLLPTGSIRLTARTAIPQLPGFAEGAWWVQDAAAALPARMLAPQPGERSSTSAAAPGGKTAQLAAAGAQVTAVDRSAPRMERLRANLERLNLQAETIVADAAAYEAGEPFDAILLDAPCSATGTIRRHPDVAWSKTMEDVFKLAELQARLLDRAATLLKPGGRLVYATCSLEREEGERQVERFLARHPRFRGRRSRPARSAARRGSSMPAATCAACRATGRTSPTGWRDSTGSSRRGLSWSPVEPITLGCTALGRHPEGRWTWSCGRNGGRCPDRACGAGQRPADGRRRGAAARPLRPARAAQAPDRAAGPPHTDPTLAARSTPGISSSRASCRRRMAARPSSCRRPRSPSPWSCTASAGCAI